MTTRYTIIENPGPAYRSKYPFAEMKPGQAFDVPRNGGRNQWGQDTVQMKVSRSASAYVRRHDPEARFTVRVLDDATIRCWRIK